jgi:acyl-CoA synthetase (AMP-forming)/AMP-acid ligase II
VPDRFELFDLGSIPSRNARRTPDKPAYLTTSRCLTWSEVNTAACRLANALADRGIKSGDHVAILGLADLGWPVAQFAVWKVGAVVMVAHAALPDDLLGAQLEQAEVKAILVGPEFEERGAKLAEQRPLLELVISWGPATAPTTVSVASVSAVASSEELPTVVDPGQSAILLYSSGTTGTPKGITHSRASLVGGVLFQATARKLQSHDVGLVAVPMFTNGGQSTSFVPYSMLGMTSVMMPAFDAESVLDAICDHGVTTMFAVPTMTRELLNAYDGRDISSLREILSAGAPMTADLMERLQSVLPNIEVTELYGLSEMNGGTVLTHDERDVERFGSVGRPGVGVDLRLVDDEGDPVPTGERGEILLRSTAQFSGYYGRPDLTAEAVTRDGWLRTGDIGVLDGEGFLFVVDRKKDMVISGGMNVYPKEVEDVLYLLPGVSECAVFGVPDDKWGEALCAVVVLSEAATLDDVAIIEHCRSKLAKFQVPKLVHLEPSLPKTATGKYDKQALRTPYWKGAGRII